MRKEGKRGGGKEEMGGGGGKREREERGGGGGVTSIQCLYVTWKTCTILTGIHAGVSLGLGLRQEHDDVGQRRLTTAMTSPLDYTSLTSWNQGTQTGIPTWHSNYYLCTVDER